MKTVRIVLLLLVITLGFPMYSQDNTVVPQRTPEQEAVRQTEKLQKELNLNSDQARQVYEINLRYARERQISNKRSEGLERAKNKNIEIQQVLSSEQNEKLQTKRFERSSFDTKTIIRNQSINPAGFRSAQPDLNSRNNSRSVNPNFQNQTDRPVRRMTTPAYRATPNQYNSYPNRTSSGSFPNNPTRRYETSTPANNASSRSQGAPVNVPRSTTPARQQNGSFSRPQSTSPAPTRRSDTPVNTNRK
jgi:hypothetical protein